MVAEGAEHHGAVCRHGIDAVGYGEVTLLDAPTLDHLHVLCRRVLVVHSRHLSGVERTILALHESVHHQCAAPFRLDIWTDIGVISASALRTPSPHIAVGTVGSGVAGIESTSVQCTLFTIRPGGIGGSLQFGDGVPLEVVYSALERAHVTIGEIPPVAHLEYVRALEEAVPNHLGELTGMRPCLEVG